MTRTKEQPLKSVIEEFLDAYHLSDKLNEVDVIQSWHKIMGNVIAKHTINLYISNKILFVTLNSAALREELSYAKNKIIKMLTERYNKPIIIDIVFR